MKTLILAATVAFGLATLSVTTNMDSALAETFNATQPLATEVASETYKAMTLEEAQQQVPFKILTADNLPGGMQLKEVRVSHPPAGIDNPNLIQAILTYATPDNNLGFVVYQQQGKFKVHNSLKTKMKQKMINGKPAVFADSSKMIAIQWEKGNVSCFAFTFAGNGVANEEALNQVAEAFK